VKEVDEQVQRHVIAILRILAGCAALLGEHSRLTKRLRLNILRTLRPVETAVRRIIIYAAARIRVKVIERAPRGKRKPHSCFHRRRRAIARSDAGAVAPVRVPAEQACMDALKDSSLTLSHCAVHPQPVTPSHRPARRHPAAGRVTARPRATVAVLSLFDPLRQTSRPRQFEPEPDMPRITLPGVTEWRSPQLPPSRNDLMESAPLRLRIDAVHATLADLPAQARRFARWQTRQDLERARRKAKAATRPPQPLPTRVERLHNQLEPPSEPSRSGRIHALRSGPPPNCRIHKFNPGARRPPGTREIDEILSHVDALAWEAWDASSRKGMRPPVSS
jgi:hypothetical protein